MKSHSARTLQVTYKTYTRHFLSSIFSSGLARNFEILPRPPSGTLPRSGSEVPHRRSACSSLSAVGSAGSSCLGPALGGGLSACSLAPVRARRRTCCPCGTGQRPRGGCGSALRGGQGRQRPLPTGDKSETHHSVTGAGCVKNG